jgi:urease accessory protein UreH
VDGRRDLSARAGLGGRQCIGTLIASNGNDEIAGAARSVLERFPEAESGATTVSGLLAVRILSSGNETVTGALRALWTELRPLVLDKAPVAPRVWAT